MRDLRELEATGFPIETDRGRGGGVRLQQSWGIGRLQLSYVEILDLLVALATMEKMPSSLLMKSLRSVRLKIAQSFPDSQRRLVENLRRRIWVGEKASDQVLSSFKSPSPEILGPLQRGFFECKQLRIHYSDEKQRLTERTIEPHYFLLNWPAWYILALDHLRSDIRFFRIDRVVGCKTLDQVFQIRDREKFIDTIKDFLEPV